MAKKTAECQTCGAALPLLKGEILACPECGMPIEPDEFEEVEEKTEAEEEEENE